MPPDAFRLTRPARPGTPVIFSSPHSGQDYHPQFLRQSVLDMQAIRSSEDAFVDQLFASAPDHGAPLLAARAPRAYLDLNRAPDELDPSVIEGIARAPHNPRISSGLGVIPRVVAGGQSIYRGKLTLLEAEYRLRHFWHPYHDMLRQLLDEAQARFGEAVLIDCHSMPHEAIETHARAGRPLPEVVLGDRFGAAASADAVDHVEQAFQNAGFRVVRNAPFAGAYIAQTYGRPAQHRHVIQIEIDRGLYMDEIAVAPRADFPAFQARMTGVVAEIAGYGAARLPLAAE